MTLMINGIGKADGGAEWVGSPNTPDPVEPEYFVFPLSPQQEGYWRADQALAGNRALNGAFRHELTGTLDLALWERAWNALVERHEGLRASVRQVDGKPALAVADALRLRIVIRDVSGLVADEREAEMERLCVKDAEFTFDLAKGPLIRVGMIKLSDERFVQTLTLHHMVCDGWSIRILMEELPQVYAALVEGRELPLPELELQLGDYLVWLQDHLKQPQIEAETRYWRDRLAGYRRVDVEPDLPRPPGPCLESDIVSRELPEDLMVRLRAFSNVQGSTIFITALAALMALLHRETGRRDVSVGSHVAGRNRPEVEGIVGALLNHVVIRVETDQDMSLRGLEEAVRERVLEAFSNQDVPLDHVVEDLAMHGGEQPDPFYSVSFISQRAFAGGNSFTSDRGGLGLRTLPSKSQGALYDIFFFLVERENGWRLSLDYRTGLFTKERAEHLLGGFIDFLGMLGSAPDALLIDAAKPRLCVGEQVAGGASPVSAAEIIEPLATGKSVADPGDVALVGVVGRADHDPRSDLVADGVPIADDGGPFVMPASYAQSRFWLLSRAAAESSAFNMPAALKIKGALDVDCLEAALRCVIARHEVLRTGFEEIDGELCQVIAPEVSFALARMSLVQCPEVEREQKLRDEIRREGGLPFDLSRPPLVRGRIIEIGRDETVFVLTLHDIVSDAQSLSNLSRELWSAYDSLSCGQLPDLPAIALQYGDFAAWQREWVGSQAAGAQLAFWQGKLSGQLPVLDFPLDRLPDHGGKAGAGLEVLALSDDLVGRLKRLAQSSNSTMFAVTGAAFAALLARYGRCREVLFGFPVANRTADTEAMLGRFAGPMAFRMDLDGDPSLGELVERARDTTYDVLGNAEYPFELLLEQVNARSVGGRNPLFQFYFLYQVAFLQGHKTRDLAIEPLPTLGVGTPFELQLALVERPTGVTAQLEYNSALLDANTVRGVLAYYASVLEALAENPACRISELAEPEVSPELRARAFETRIRPVFEAPRCDAERRLIALWEQVLRQSSIGVHDDWFDLGGTSIAAARLVGAIEKEFKVRTSISMLAFARTVAQMADVIVSKDGAAASLVVPMRPGNNDAPVFLIHCGGGHVLRYKEFVNALPEGHSIYGISAPPIEEINGSTRVEDLARRYIEEIRKVQPGGPYRIGGYSFGGLVAYEMAAQLSAMGDTIALLAVFDTANPSYYHGLGRVRRLGMRLIHRADVVSGYAGLVLTGQFSRIGERVRDTCGIYGRKLSWKLRQLRVGVSAGQKKRVVEDFLSEFTIIARRYSPPRAGFGLVLFYGRQRGREYLENPTLGWEKLVDGDVCVRFVPGDHETLMLGENATVLAKAFGSALGRVG